MLTLISTKCCSSDPPKALAVRVASDYLENKLKNSNLSDRATVVERLSNTIIITTENGIEDAKPSNQFISGIREAIYGNSQIPPGNHLTNSASIEIQSLPDHHITIYQSCRLFLLVQQLLTTRPSSSSSQLLKTSTSFQQLFYDDPENLNATFFLQQHLVRTLHHYHKHSFPAALTILRTIKQIVSDDFTQSYVKNLLKFGIAEVLNQIYISISGNLYTQKIKENSENFDDMLEEAESCVLKLIYASCKAISGLVIQTKDSETSNDAKNALADAQNFSNLTGCLIKRLSDYSMDANFLRIPLLNTSRVLFIVLQLYGVGKNSGIEVKYFCNCLSKNSILVKNSYLDVVKFIIKGLRRLVKVEREVNKKRVIVEVESGSLEVLKNLFKEELVVITMLDDIFV